MMQIYFSTIIASFRRLGLLGFFTVHLFSVHLSRSKTKIDRLGIRVEVFEMASNARRNDIFFHFYRVSWTLPAISSTRTFDELTTTIRLKIREDRSLIDFLIALISFNPHELLDHNSLYIANSLRFY